MNEFDPVQHAFNFAPSDAVGPRVRQDRTSEGAFLHVCPKCKTGFNKKPVGKHMACSRKCYASLGYRARNPLQEIKTCPECKIQFKPLYARKRFCSPKCQRSSRNKKLSEIRTCPTCKNKFQAENKRGRLRTFCSGSCKDSFHAKETKNKERSRIAYINLRTSVLNKYGNKCSQCGESRTECLQLDHVFGDGSRERSFISPTRILKSALYDDSGRYDLLCANCNWVKRVRNKETK